MRTSESQLILWTIVHCTRRKIRCLLVSDEPEKRCVNCIRMRKECSLIPAGQQPAMKRRTRTGTKTKGKSGEISASSASSPQNNERDSEHTPYFVGTSNSNVPLSPYPDYLSDAELNSSESFATSNTSIFKASDISPPFSGDFKCTCPGCTAYPSQRQYLLK